MTPTHPAAYIRKSHKDAASADAQLASIQEMAVRQGVTAPLAVYADVGVSGRHGKRGTGTAWARLGADIEAGAVTLVYVTALDRAGRSLREWLAFTALCVDHHVEVRDQSGQDRTNGDAEDIATIEMMMAQREGRKAVERSARGRTTQERRGDEVYQGQAPYGWHRVRAGTVGAVSPEHPDPERIVQVRNPAEDVQVVIDAVREASSITGAAKLLNARGVPARGTDAQRKKGIPARWSQRTVGRVIERDAPELVPVGATGRVKMRQDHRLARLLRCPCGQLLTGAKDRDGRPWYYCSNAKRDAAHPRPNTISESKVLPWVRDEAVHLDIPGDELEAADRKPAATAAQLRDRLARVAENYEEGLIDRATRDKKVDGIRAEIATTATMTRTPIPLLADLPRDWSTLPAADVNTALRAIFREVVLGLDLLPVRAVWTRDDWRAA